jgi:hypothetical protein
MLSALSERERWLKEMARTSPESRAQTIRDLEDLGSREETTQRDYVGRYPLELLQNAHDACSAAGIKGTVRFEVSRTALLVANFGQPFDASRIRSLVRQGTSEKADRRRKRTIGYKGVGFSSVFEISRTPQIICANGIAFGFDRDRAKAQVVEYLKPRKPLRTVAARNFPFLLEPAAWAEDAELVEDLQREGFVTIVRLPFKRGYSAAEVYDHIADQFVPETMAFLPSVNCLRCRYGDEVFGWSAKPGNRVGAGKVLHIDAQDGTRVSWLIHSGKTPVDRAAIDELEDPAWRNVGELRLTVGLPWSNRRINPDSPDEPIHVYFPTSERTGRSCLIHGDFYVDSRRSQILDQGAASTINRCAAGEAARLIAELAESLAAKHAHQLFAALAVTGTPSQFGKVLNAEIVEALQGARIGRPADGAELRQIGELSFITKDQAVELDERLMAVMSKRDDLLCVADYQHGRAVTLVQELGIDGLTSEETAARVTLANSKLPYEKGLALLGEWVGEISYPSYSSVLEVLRQRKIAQDIDGRWCPPKNAVMSAAGVPPLPDRLRRRELKPVKPDAAREFLTGCLGIEDLDPAGALGIINKALDDKEFGQDEEEKRALHDWLFALWRSASKAFAGGRVLLGRAPVRVRRAAETSETWGQAGQAYFGSAWSQTGSQLELLYAPDGRSEFVADVSGIVGATKSELADFYRDIGVARLPRLHSAAPPHTSLLGKWEQLEEVQKASRCPLDHHTYQIPNVLVWDRLDQIIERACGSQAASAALTELVRAAEQPLGKDATFTCDHRAHRGRARPRSAQGYQAWRLRQSEWLTVRNDPGKRERRAPIHTWASVPRAARQLLIPQPIASKLPPALGLIPWESPAVRDLEGALEDLHQAVPDLSTADDAATTADRLLRKLESVLSPDDAGRGPVPLPARDGSVRTWTTEGVIADIPGLENLAHMAVVDVTLASRVRQAYGLRAMSEMVTQHVHADGADDVAAVLPYDRRLELLVLLGHAGADRATVARNLIDLREQPVQRIDVETIVDGQSTYWSRHLPFYLIKEGKGTSLYVTSQMAGHRVRLAQVLADYLGVHRHANLLALILSNPDEMAEPILDSELDEAAELLAPSEDDQREASAEAQPVPHDASPSPHERVGSPVAQDTQAQPETEVATSVTEEPAVGGSSDGVSHKPSSGSAGASRSPISRPSGDVGHSSPPPGRALGESASVSPLRHPSHARFAAPTDPHFLERPTTAPRMSDTPSATGHSGGPRSPSASPDGTARSDEQAERAAIDYVCEYAKRELRVETVMDRQQDKCGWDLEFVYSDGHCELVEVKGSGGEGPFGLTANELRQARLNQNYVLYFLAEQRGGVPKLYRFDHLGERLEGGQHLRPSAWWVDGWRDLEPQLIEITFG